MAGRTPGASRRLVKRGEFWGKSLLGLTAAKRRGYIVGAFHLWIKPITKKKNE
jgi:hypothetical protein